MSSEDGTSDAVHAHLVLGAPRGASRTQLQAAYWRLRAHVEERARASSDATFVTRREEEIEALTRALRAALGGGPVAPSRARRKPLRVGTARARALWIWAIAASCSSIVLGVLLLRSAPPPPDPPIAAPTPAPAARLAVRADPPGARLEVVAAGDDRIVATGPADGSTHELPAGPYRLRVDRDDCAQDWRHEVSLSAGEEVSFAPRLCEGEGAVVVRSNVAGDRLLIDGVDSGSTGPEPHRLSAGDHEVRVEKEGFEAWRGTVRVRPGEELTLRADLAASSAAAPQAAARPPAASTPPALPPASAERAAEKAPTGLDLPAPPLAEDPLRVAQGGSKKWHDDVRQRLLEKYDADGSRQLDSPEEINAVPCSEWRSIQSSYATGGLSVPMTRLYGFDGSEWVPGALGMSREMRGYAYDRMRQCGLP